MRNAGCVYFLPPEARAGGDPKERRHVLLAECQDHDDIATLAYASTQAVEARHRAPNVLVNPATSSFQQTGFDLATYVYPARLISAYSEELVEAEGRVIDDMPAIRDQLRAALGIGTGVANGSGAAAGSYRGRFIHLTQSFLAEVGTDIAVVMADPVYSRAERYWNVVPVISLAEFDSEEGDVEVKDETAVQLAAYDSRYKRCALFVAGVQAVFCAEEVDGVAPLCLDAGTLADLELALRLRFDL